MFCIYCGTNNPDDALFCRSCGRRQRSATDDTIIPVPLFPGAPGESGQPSIGNVPSVQGTPHVSDVPTAQGTPSLPGSPLAMPGTTHSTVPSALSPTLQAPTLFTEPGGSPGYHPYTTSPLPSRRESIPSSKPQPAPPTHALLEGMQTASPGSGQQMTLPPVQREVLPPQPARSSNTTVVTRVAVIFVEEAVGFSSLCCGLPVARHR
jgi:hypothetical protein